MIDDVYCPRCGSTRAKNHVPLLRCLIRIIFHSSCMRISNDKTGVIFRFSK